MLLDEIIHMMELTKPKLIFCEADNLTTVRESLMQMHISVPVFTIDVMVEGVRFVDELFIETGIDINQFV